MTRNDPVQDTMEFNPPGVGSVDFEDMLFEDIDIGELFWKNDSANNNDNHACRKIEENVAFDTKTRQYFNISLRTSIYQKI
jgi:hypothetical protein